MFNLYSWEVWSWSHLFEPNEPKYWTENIFFKRWSYIILQKLENVGYPGYIVVDIWNNNNYLHQVLLINDRNKFWKLTWTKCFCFSAGSTYITLIQNRNVWKSLSSFINIFNQSLKIITFKNLEIFHILDFITTFLYSISLCMYT